MLKNIALFTSLSSVILSGCKTTSNESAALSFPPGYEEICGTLNKNMLTASPGDNTYLLEAADGATENIINSLDGQKVCVNADFSMQEVIVRSAHFITPKYENLCGVLGQNPSGDPEYDTTFSFVVQSDRYRLEAADGAVLNTLGANINNELCIKADFRNFDVIVESVANIKTKEDK